MSKAKEIKKKGTKYSEAGKGSVPRRGMLPDRWDERWEKIFGKKDKEPDEKKSN